MKGFSRLLQFAFFLVFGVIVSSSASASAKNGTSFPKPALDDPIASTSSQETAILSGGCFWGVQAVYEHTRGVISVTSGYSGGNADTAHYDIVSTGRTGHAESVKVVFDPSRITYGQILMIFFSVAHNPTELNKQGPDWGTQYRSAIFFANPEQQKIATAYIAQLDAAKIYSQKIVTQIVPLKEFFPAEPYHQDYVKHHPDNPYIVINDLPKLANFRKQFPDLYHD